MSHLLEPLQQLQTALEKMGEKYQFAMSELARLKAQPSIDPELLEELQSELALAKQQGQELESQFNEQQSQFQEFEERYQSLAESHNMLSAEYENLQAELHAQKEANQKLLDKNRVAADHTKLVLERLAKIDSEAPTL